MNDNDFKRELESLLNRAGWDNKTNTPDFILADQVFKYLCNTSTLMIQRDSWYRFDPWAGIKTLEDPDNGSQDDSQGV